MKYNYDIYYFILRDLCNELIALAQNYELLPADSTLYNTLAEMNGADATDIEEAINS